MEPTPTTSWPDPGEWTEPTPEAATPTPRRKATPEPRTGNAVGDVLAAAFANRKRRTR